MAIRVLLALILALALAPMSAAAACHQPVPTMTAHHGMHHGSSTTPTVAMADACIGCIPPADWLGARIPARILVTPPPYRFDRAAFAPGLATAPVPPPPRSA